LGQSLKIPGANGKQKFQKQKAAPKRTRLENFHQPQLDSAPAAAAV